MHTGAGEQGADGDLPVRHVEVQLITTPVLPMPLAADLSADVAACRQLLQHATERLPALPFHACAAIGRPGARVRFGFFAPGVFSCLLCLLLLPSGCPNCGRPTFSRYR